MQGEKHNVNMLALTIFFMYVLYTFHMIWQLQQYKNLRIFQYVEVA